MASNGWLLFFFFWCLQMHQVTSSQSCWTSLLAPFRSPKTAFVLGMVSIFIWSSFTKFHSLSCCRLSSVCQCGVQKFERGRACRCFPHSHERQHPNSMATCCCSPSPGCCQTCTLILAWCVFSQKPTCVNYVCDCSSWVNNQVVAAAAAAAVAGPGTREPTCLMVLFSGLFYMYCIQSLCHKCLVLDCVYVSFSCRCCHGSSSRGHSWIFWTHLWINQSRQAHVRRSHGQSLFRLIFVDCLVACFFLFGDSSQLVWCCGVRVRWPVDSKIQTSSGHNQWNRKTGPLWFFSVSLHLSQSVLAACVWLRVNARAHVCLLSGVLTCSRRICVVIVDSDLMFLPLFCCLGCDRWLPGVVQIRKDRGLASGMGEKRGGQQVRRHVCSMHGQTAQHCAAPLWTLVCVHRLQRQRSWLPHVSRGTWDVRSLEWLDVFSAIPAWLLLVFCPRIWVCARVCVCVCVCVWYFQS